MDAEQAALVQETFEQIQPIAGAVTDLFYKQLFKLDPSTRALFRGDMQQQQRKFIDMLGTILRQLNQIDEVIPEIEEMGRRHMHYGVQSKHYAMVGVALLGALRQGLGERFTPEVEVAWARTYALLADTMEQAAIRERLGVLAE